MCGGGGARHDAAAAALCGLSRCLLLLLVLVSSTLALFGLGRHHCSCRGGGVYSSRRSLSGRTWWTDVDDGGLLGLFVSPNHSTNSGGGTRGALPFVGHDLFVVLMWVWR